MGAAASFEGGLSSLGRGHPRYFCHACSRAFPLGSNEEHICPHCGSTFLEEIGSVHQHNHFGQLTIEQARRIANATAMLRLLETQLREELDMLQLAFEQANARAQTISQDKPKVLTKIMKSRLRNVELDLDMLCCQPSCPICSEDFSVGLKVLRLPCTHWFHGSCVLAWLELNQTCPICRSEISDSLPTKDELGELSLEDLDERLKDLNIEIADLRSKEK